MSQIQKSVMKFKSETKRYGVSKYEDYLEKCFTELGLPCKRRQVFCFLCLSMWTNNSNEYPDKCDHCGNNYTERRMYCMPDIVLEDPERHGKAVIFVNGKHHEKPKIILKDKFQISVLRKNNWKCFVIDNSEIDHLEHIKQSNIRFLVLGMWRAMKDSTAYWRAIEGEKEIPCLK